MQLREAIRSPMLVPVWPFDQLDRAQVAGPAENEASSPLPCLSAGVITRLSAGDSQHHTEFWEGTRGRTGALVVEGLERGSDEWDRPQLSAGSGMIWQRLCVADCPSLS